MTTAAPTQLLPRAWQAEWIEPVDADGLHDVQRPGYHVVGEVRLAEPVTSATLHVTARGLYEAFVNGHRVGDAELTPGFTAYRARLQVQSWSVTDLLVPGDNAVGFLITDGWWRGQTTVARRSNCYGSTVAVLAELHVVTPSATRVALATDAGWWWRTSHILGADLIAGEHHDLRLMVPGWSEPGCSREGWEPVRVADHPTDVLVPTLGPTVRRTEELAAVSLREVAPGRHIVDFGRCSNGWVRVTDLGPAGTELRLEHGEALTPDGAALANEPHAVQSFVVDRPVQVPFQVDVVVSAGPGSVFEPRHSTKGFRYLRVDGHPGPLAAESFSSVVVRSDLRQVGGFDCSDADLVALHRAAEWSLLTNACDIPTDCPTRERAGWTGDWQIYVETAAYLYDVTDFSRKWLADLAAEQLPDGRVLHFVPDPADHTSPHVSWWTALQGSAGWGDAAVHVPWQLYLATGRTDVLAESYDSMRAWVDWCAAAAAGGRHPDRVAARPQPAAHENYLWDSGFHFGEWNEPGQDDAEQVQRLQVMDHGPTATAYLYRSADELAQTARLLGDDAAAHRYTQLAQHVVQAWRAEFVGTDGTVIPQTQANLVRALAFGLVPDAARSRAVTDLVRLVREADTHLGTGFLATPFLLPVLADNGELGLAYELLLRRTPPSWLAMLDAGATTIWEGWQSMDAEGRVHSSLNHFSMGAVISFLHSHLAGLRRTAPGWSRFRVEPQPGGDVTRASTHHDSPHGRIAVAWSVHGPEGVIEVTVPPGTLCELVLAGGAETLEPGRHTRTWEAR